MRADPPVDEAAIVACLGHLDATIRRRPYPYETSHKLDELEVILADGTRLEFLLKDLRRSSLGSSARRVKPHIFHDPFREAEAYRLLVEAGLGKAICRASGRDWLLLEKVRGVELWQVGRLQAWVDAARWLARLHAHFAARRPTSLHLLNYNAEYFRMWSQRALRHHPSLRPILRHHERVVEL